MGVIDDVRKWLKEIPLWQQLETIPRRTDELEARVAALEKKLERSEMRCACHASQRGRAPFRWEGRLSL